MVEDSLEDLKVNGRLIRRV